MKKIILVVVVILIALALFFTNKESSTMSKSLSDFAVEDTSSIQRVFFC